MRNRLQWAGHIERMADDRVPKRAAELCEQGRRRPGRPRLRWEDCVKRDVIIIIIMAGMAVVLRGWLPHRGEAQMAYNFCFPTRTMFSINSEF